MPPPELVNAYVDGRISRRTLIRRLVAAGVSAGAAISYAELLSPTPAAARSVGDPHHPEITVRIPDQDLDRVRRDRRIKIKFTTERPVPLSLETRLLRPNHQYPNSQIGYKFFQVNSAGSHSTYVRLNANPPYSHLALKGRERARIRVIATEYRNALSTVQHERVLRR